MTIQELKAELLRQVASPKTASMATIKIGIPEMRALLAHIEALESSAAYLGKHHQITETLIGMVALAVDRNRMDSVKAALDGYRPSLRKLSDERMAALAEQGEPK